MDFPKYEENEILKAVPVSISAQANVVKNRTMRGQALWYVAPGRGELREAVVAPAGSGKVRVRALFGAISRGTERLVLAGRVPESEFDRMRPPFMGGSFPFPVKYGYATVGRLEDGPAQNQLVFALHPHQDRGSNRARQGIALPTARNLPMWGADREQGTHEGGRQAYAQHLGRA